MANPLTVIIPCKDEASNIRDCLHSVQLVADEVLVADSGSTDGTLDAVREWGGCRIIEREYRSSGDFKNWAIPQATHDWVLVVDADERVSPELAQEIRNLLAQTPPHHGYWVYRANHFMGYRVKYGPWGRDKVLRLFNRRHARYVGASDHAEVCVRTGQVGYLKSRLTHYTFWTYGQYLQKIERYSAYQAEIWHQQGRRPSRLRMLCNVPFRFFVTYVLRMGFLDGIVGFQVCMLIAYYSFLKQGRHWELCYAQPQVPSAKLGPTAATSATPRPATVSSTGHTSDARRTSDRHAA